jgi:hypothetical protein
LLQGKIFQEVNIIKKETDQMRLDPEQRICSNFDSYSIAKYPIATTKEMGMRVRDNCAEEHIM